MMNDFLEPRRLCRIRVNFYPVFVRSRFSTSPPLLRLFALNACESDRLLHKTLEYDGVNRCGAKAVGLKMVGI